MTTLDWRRGLSLELVKRGSTIYNYIPNPKFASNVTSCWSPGGAGLVASGLTMSGGPTAGMPSTMTRAAKLVTGEKSCAFRVGDFVPWEANADNPLIQVQGGASYCFSAWVNKTAGTCSLCVYWYRPDGTFSGQDDQYVSDTGGSYVFAAHLVTAPADAVSAQPAFHLDDTNLVYTVYVTGAMFAPSSRAFTTSDYTDGDTPGYRWLDDQNASYTVDSIDNMDLSGRAWDMTRLATDIRFESRIPGGFAGMSFVVPRPVDHTYYDLARDQGVKLSLNGRVLWQGTVEAVEPVYDTTERLQVHCVGLYDFFKRSHAFRRVYKDKSLEHWKADQTNDHAGLFYHTRGSAKSINSAVTEKKPQLHIQLPKSISVPAGSSHRLYYQLFDGVHTADYIKRVTFNYSYNLGSSGSNWLAEIVGMPDIADLENYPAGDNPDQDPQPQTAVIWPTSGSPQNGGTATDLNADIALTGCFRAIALRLRRTSSEASSTSDIWVKIEDICVYATSVTPASGADNINVGTIMADIGGQMATTVNVPDQTSFTLDHVAFSSYTTRAKALEHVSHLITAGNYDYAVWDNGAFTAGVRPQGSAIPASQHYIVRLGQPGVDWQVAPNYRDAYDGVVVRYRRAGAGKDREIAEVARPHKLAHRIAVLDYTHEHQIEPAEAGTLATSFLANRAAGTMSGTVVLTGDIKTVRGAVLPAAVIRAGDWIENISLPKHQPLFITHATTDLATGEVLLVVNDGRHLKPHVNFWERVSKR